MHKLISLKVVNQDRSMLGSVFIFSVEQIFDFSIFRSNRWGRINCRASFWDTLAYRSGSQWILCCQFLDCQSIHLFRNDYQHMRIELNLIALTMRSSSQLGILIDVDSSTSPLNVGFFQTLKLLPEDTVLIREKLYGEHTGSEPILVELLRSPTSLQLIGICQYGVTALLGFTP